MSVPDPTSVEDLLDGYWVIAPHGASGRDLIGHADLDEGEIALCLSTQAFAAVTLEPTYQQDILTTSVPGKKEKGSRFVFNECPQIPVVKPLHHLPGVQRHYLAASSFTFVRKLPREAIEELFKRIRAGLEARMVASVDEPKGKPKGDS